MRTLKRGLSAGGGTDLERGYGDVRPWRPPFHASPAARKGPISSKRVNSQDPLLRKFWNFSLYSLNFHPNFSSQAPNFGNLQLTSPQIWKLSAHKPPFSDANVSSQLSPTLQKSGPHTPIWKKSWVPPWLGWLGATAAPLVHLCNIWCTSIGSQFQPFATQALLKLVHGLIKFHNTKTGHRQ